LPILKVVAAYIGVHINYARLQQGSNDQSFEKKKNAFIKKPPTTRLIPDIYDLVTWIPEGFICHQSFNSYFDRDLKNTKRKFNYE